MTFAPRGVTSAPSTGSVMAVSAAFMPVSWGQALLNGDGLVALNTSYASDSREDVQQAAQAAASAIAGQPVQVPSSDASWVGGSAGLALALAGLNDFSQGNLTRGRVVAATGEVDASGGVSQVGSVPLKAIAAAQSGATVFVVPTGQGASVRAQVPSLDVIEASSLSEAVEALCSGQCRFAVRQR